MDTSTIIIIIAVAAILFFLWPRVSRRRNLPSNVNPPGVTGEGNIVPPSNRSTQSGVTPHTDRAAGQVFPTASRGSDLDEVEESLDDVQSQNPNKSL